MSTNHIHLKYMYKPDLALNNLQWLICHKTKPNCWNSIVRLSTNKSVLTCTIMNYELKGNYMDIGTIRRWPSPFPGQWLVAGPVSGYISVYIHWLAFSHVSGVIGLVLSYCLFYFLSAIQMLAGAAERLSVVILVYSAH